MSLVQNNEISRGANVPGVQRLDRRDLERVAGVPVKMPVKPGRCKPEMLTEPLDCLSDQIILLPPSMRSAIRSLAITVLPAPVGA
jgi:hypothetical protein